MTMPIIAAATAATNRGTANDRRSAAAGAEAFGVALSAALDDAPAGPQERLRQPDERRGAERERPEPLPRRSTARPPAHLERPERAERPERPERPERAERLERPDRAERPERPERAERSERPERPERAERRERADQADPAEDSAQAERPAAAKDPATGVTDEVPPVVEPDAAVVPAVVLPAAVLTAEGQTATAQTATAQPTPVLDATAGAPQAPPAGAATTTTTTPAGVTAPATAQPAAGEQATQQATQQTSGQQGSATAPTGTATTDAAAATSAATEAPTGESPAGTGPQSTSGQAASGQPAGGAAGGQAGGGAAGDGQTGTGGSAQPAAAAVPLDLPETATTVPAGQPVHTVPAASTAEAPAGPVPVGGVAPAAPTAPSTPAAAATGAAPSATPPPAATQMAMRIAPLRLEADGVHRLTVHLHPVDLGAVQVVAEIRNGDINLSLAGATEAGREALKQSLADLKRELTQSGFTNCNLDLKQGSPQQEQARQHFAFLDNGRGGDGRGDNGTPPARLAESLPPAAPRAAAAAATGSIRLDLHA